MTVSSSKLIICSGSLCRRPYVKHSKVIRSILSNNRFRNTGPSSGKFGEEILTVPYE